jgi:hypothetical protein
MSASNEPPMSKPAISMAKKSSAFFICLFDLILTNVLQYFRYAKETLLILAKLLTKIC